MTHLAHTGGGRTVTRAPHEAAILTLSDGCIFVPIERIVAIVARAHGMTSERLKGRCRERAVVLARRHLVHVLFRDKPKLSSAETGRRIGLDHSSVVYARAHFRESAPEIAAQIKAVDDALNRLRGAPHMEATE